MEVAHYCNKSPKLFLQRTSHPQRSQRITGIAITEDLKKETISCTDKAAVEHWSHCLLPLFITFAFSQGKEGEGRSARDWPVVFGVLEES